VAEPADGHRPRPPALAGTPVVLPMVVAGTPVVLHPERAVELPADAVLVIADLHLGKAAALRAHGIPVPPGGTRDDLARLDRVLDRTGARHLVVLGDLGHSRHAWEARAAAPFAAWRVSRPALAITLVRGNHDRHAGDPPATLAITTVDPPARLGPFALHHEPPDAPGAGPALSGHLHPTLSITGRGRQRLRLPCFVQRGDSLLLPAFSAFTGGGAWRPAPGDRPFLVAGGEVLPFDAGGRPA
jgi:DNA ligase-associated metallophosphoesterase